MIRLSFTRTPPETSVSCAILLVVSSGTSGQGLALALRYQEQRRHNVNQIDQGEQRDGGGERVRRRERADHERAESPDSAAEVEQHVLGRRARLGRIEFRQQR